MRVSILTIDFWNTLYRHKGTSEYRSQIREERLLEYCETLGLKEPREIAKSFFSAVDNFIKTSWTEGRCVSLDEIINYAVSYYNAAHPAEKLALVFDQLGEIYSTVLKPELFEGARFFLQWASSRWPLYLICDTYTVRGAVIDSILRSDGLMEFFQARMYSDVVGVQKPSVVAIDSILRMEGKDAAELVHIGDLLERDYELARNAGSYCILIEHAGGNISFDLRLFDRLLNRCTSFTEVQETLDLQDG